MSGTYNKINLYILSLALLFVFLIIITVDVPICFGNNCKFVGIQSLVSSNLVAGGAFILLIYCVFAFKRFDFALKGSTDIPFTINNVRGIDYEHLTFLATYVVPLISFDFDSSRQMIVLALLLIVMGIIYIKTDLFYANPSLALLGFQIYRADGNFKGGVSRKGIVLICRGDLLDEEKVEYIKLDNNIYYVKKL